MALKDNCYLACVASSEEEAKNWISTQIAGAYVHMLHLVHKEEPEEPEESPTYVFSFLADGGTEEVGEFLHDHYDLPHLPNHPIEFV